MAITQEVNIELLEKLPDGNFKIKYPKTKAEQVGGLSAEINKAKIETSRDLEGNIRFSDIIASNNTEASFNFNNSNQSGVWHDLKSINSIDTSKAHILRFSLEIQNPYFPATYVRIINDAATIISDELVIGTPISNYAWHTISLFEIPDLGVQSFKLQIKPVGAVAMNNFKCRGLNVVRNKITYVRGEV